MRQQLECGIWLRAEIWHSSAYLSKLLLEFLVEKLLHLWQRFCNAKEQNHSSLQTQGSPALGRVSNQNCTARGGYRFVQSLDYSIYEFGSLATEH